MKIVTQDLNLHEIFLCPERYLSLQKTRKGWLYMGSFLVQVMDRCTVDIFIIIIVTTTSYGDVS